MGCDFYIIRYFKVEHVNGTAYFELPSKQCYFCDCDWHVGDSDDDEDANINEDVVKLYNQYKKMVMRPNKPITIYEDGQFMSEDLEKKYRVFINGLLTRLQRDPNRADDRNTGKMLQNFEDIIQITKVEERRPRFT
jgi:hypothetical protein